MLTGTGTDRRHTAPTPRRHRLDGFTLVELMVTIALIGILAVIAVPAFGTWSSDAKVRSTAEQLLSSLRLTQATAVARNRVAVFALTNATPAYDATPAANGSNWVLRLLPLAGTDETAASLGAIQTATVARANGVSLTGPALVCFNAMGQQATESAATTGVSPSCTAPTDDTAAPTTFVVSRSGATRQYKLLVYLGGRVRMCDAAKTLSNSNPDGCP